MQSIIERTEKIVAELEKLVCTAQSDATAAVAKASQIASVIDGIANSIRLETMALHFPESNVCAAFSMALGDLDSAAVCLISSSPESILKWSTYALEHARDALDVMNSV